MIISHKHKFIYIKSGKTASTSLQIALSKFCGDKDIITREPEDKDESFKKQISGHGSQNNLFLIPRPFYQNIYHNIKQCFKVCSYILTMKPLKNNVIFLNNLQWEKFYSHITAWKVKKLIGKQMWNNYYKFTIVRNPWDQFISYYYWANKIEEQRSNINFKLFVKSNSKRFFSREFERYTKNQVSLLDKFIFFEKFEEDLNFISNKLNLPSSLFETFKNIKTKHNIRQSSKVQIEIDDETNDIIISNAKQILRMHKYKSYK